MVSGSQVILTNQQTKAKATAVTDSQGAYTFPSLQPGAYVVEVDATGFKASVSPELKVAAGQTVNFDFALTLAGVAQSVNVSAGTVENAYRVDNVAAGGPLGTTPILDLPYSVNVISRQLIDDTQSRNFKEAAKYLPLVSFQEMQGPEVLRPETRGMQGSNMQNDLKDGMGIAVTTPSALEEYEQIEVVNGLGGPLYGPANPSGMFNFVTKRPTEERLGELELDYEGNTVGDRAYGPRRALRQEQNVRLSHEPAGGRWQRLCQPQPAPPSTGRGGGRCTRDQPYHDRRELQLLQRVAARVSRLVCLFADNDLALHSRVEEHSDTGTGAGPDPRRLWAIVLGRESDFADRRITGQARLQFELASRGGRAAPDCRP